MRPVLAFLRMDLSAQRRAVCALPVVALLMVVLAKVTGLPVPIGLLMAANLVPAILPSQFFAMDERGRLDLLCALLPVSRRQVVAGRHLTMGALAALTSCLCALGSRLSEQVAPSGERLPITVMFCVGFTFVCLLLAVQTSLYFALGPARVISLATAAVFFAAMAMVGKVADSLQHATPETLGRALTWSWTAPAAVAVGVALMAVSVGVSTPLYARRAL